MISIFKRKIAIDDVFKFSYYEQKEYLNSFSEPRDEIDRSFFQYKCQQYKRSKRRMIVLNFLSFFLFFIFIPFFLLKSIFSTRKNQKREAIFPYKGKYGQIIPKEYKSKYSILETPYQSGLKNSELALQDLVFIFKVFRRYPLNFYFVTTFLYKLSFYRYLINKYSPTIIFVSSEYSFSSSLLTKYCDEMNITHINVMHGEKFFCIVDAFFKFHKCVVWDKYYEELFVELRADKLQFEILIPESLNMGLDLSEAHIYDITYYLTGERDDQLVLIAKMLQVISELGFKVCVRFHPRYSDIGTIREIFQNIIIENPEEVSLKSSFEKTKYLASFFSTVLFQGLFNNKEVIIDDITFSEDFLLKLKEFRYFVFTKDIKWMSKEFPQII